MSSGRAVTAALGVIVFAALLPLQWETLASVPGVGVLRWFHIGGVIMVLLARPRWRDVRAMLARSRPVFEGFGAFMLCALITAVAWASNPSDFVQLIAYAVLGLAGGGSLLVAMQHAAGRRWLLWASPVSLLTFSVEFYRSMQAAGVSPFAVIGRAVVSADPTLIEFGLFRAGFNADGTTTDVRSNVRHEIFAALVVVLAVTLMADAVSRTAKTVRIASVVLTVVMVLISQSRSVLLAVALAAAVAVVRVIVTRRIRAGTLVLFVIVLAGGAIAFPAVGGLVVSRLTETKSYDARLGAFDLSANDVLNRLAVGGPRLDVSTHNLVADAALRGGFMAGIGAAVLLFGLFRIAWRAVRVYATAPTLFTFAPVLAIAVTLVRSFTAGGGQLVLPEWFAVGLALAAVVHRRRHPVVTAPAPAAAAPPPLPVRAPRVKISQMS